MENLEDAFVLLENSNEARMFVEECLPEIVSVLLEETIIFTPPEDKSVHNSQETDDDMEVDEFLQRGVEGDEDPLEQLAQQMALRPRQAVDTPHQSDVEDDGLSSDETQQERTFRIRRALNTCFRIIAKDIEIQNCLPGKSLLLGTLWDLLNPRKPFYQQFMEKERRVTVLAFSENDGFRLIQQYFWNHRETITFSELVNVKYALDSSHHVCNAELEDLKDLGRHTVDWITHYAEENLQYLALDPLMELLQSLRKFFDSFMSRSVEVSFKFYKFWRWLCLRMIMHPELPLKRRGWNMLRDIIKASAMHRPVPRVYWVEGAGSSFCNGKYEYVGQLGDNMYTKRGDGVSYARIIPPGEPQAGRKLTIFLCTLRSRQKWWFLSETDEKDPGSDADLNFYQHQSGETEHSHPPETVWWTCRDHHGADPPPTLRAQGFVMNPDRPSLEHELVKWAITNDIVENVFRQTAHPELVVLSTVLIKFLATMRREQPADAPYFFDGARMEILNHYFVTPKRSRNLISDPGRDTQEGVAEYSPTKKGRARQKSSPSFD